MTKSSIYKLRAEAVMAGDSAAVSLCDMALAGDRVAIADCRAWRDSVRAQRGVVVGQRVWEIADRSWVGIVVSVDDDDDTASVSLDDGSLHIMPVCELEGVES